MPLVRLVQVRKTFRNGELELEALRGVDFRVDRGELVVIMGASGSGKSTLLNILGTLDRPSSGQYLFDGQPVEALSEEALAQLRSRKMGFVFQQFHLLPRERALENVELPMVYLRTPRSERRAKAQRALERVGLADRMDHLPSQLSGGQQQRVSIARAIVNEPLILFADEPTGALDSATSRQVMELFCELHRGGMTVVVVTHDPAVAAYADRVVTFRDGTIVTDLPQERHARPALDGALRHSA